MIIQDKINDKRLEAVSTTLEALLKSRFKGAVIASTIEYNVHWLSKSRMHSKTRGKIRKWLCL